MHVHLKCTQVNQLPVLCKQRQQQQHVFDEGSVLGVLQGTFLDWLCHPLWLTSMARFAHCANGLRTVQQ
jgi:hypothetical protein